MVLKIFLISVHVLKINDIEVWFGLLSFMAYQPL